MTGSVTVGGGAVVTVSVVDGGEGTLPRTRPPLGSESAAVTSPGAAGSTTQLPSSGMPVWPLLATGVGFLLGGVLLRRRALSGSAS